MIDKHVFSTWTGVDDADSECGLDTGVSFDHVIINNGHSEQLEANLQQLENIVKERMTIH
jgi:phosphomevalonate kinase